MTTRHRPIGITILAVLGAIAAVLAAVSTLQYLHLVPFVLGPVSFFGFDPLGALLWGITTVVWVWVAVQLWSLNAQGWLFLVLISGLNIVLALLSVIGSTSFFAVLPSIAVNAVVLIYCQLPGVRSAFGREALGPATT
jgi:hypothetical protein